MPLLTDDELTPALKRRLLQNEGLNPDAYDVLTDGSIIPMANYQPPAPAASTTLLKGANDNVRGPSGLESFGRAAAESAIPTGTGLGGAAGGAALGTLIAPGPGTLIGGILGGLGGSALGSYGQQKLVPQSVKQSLFSRPEDIAQHPVASFAGGLAPSALAFNPARSLANVPQLLSGAGKLVSPSGVASVGRSALTSAEQTMLANAAINTAVAGGQELVSPEPFSPGRFAANAIAPSLLMTAPTKGIGQRLLGFHDPAAQTFPVEAGQPRPSLTTPEGTQPLPLVVPREPNTGTIITPEGQVVPAGQAIKRTNLAGEEIIGGYTGEPGTPMNRPAKSAQQAAGVIQQGDRGLDYSMALAEKAKQDAQAEYDAAKAAATKELLGTAVTRPEVRTKPLATTELGKEIMPDYTGVTEHDRATLAAEPAETQAEYEQRLYEEGKRRQETTLPEQQKLQTDERLRALEDAEAARRGFGLERQPTLPAAPGRQTKGQLDYPTRTAKVATPLAGEDTAGHEVLGHGYLGDLLRSAAQRDRDLAIRGIREFSGRRDIKTAEDFLKLPQSEQAAIEEAFAQSVGQEAANRRITQAYGTKKAKLKQTWEDIKAHVKYKFGSEDPSVLLTHYGARAAGDAPYGTRMELAPKPTGGATPTTVRTQEGDKPSDYQQYLDVQARISALVKAKKFDGPEFQEAWAENEAIKNRHGGMPPEKPAPASPFDKMREEALGSEEAKKIVPLSEEVRGNEDLRRYKNRYQDEPVASETPATPAEPIEKRGKTSFIPALTSRIEKIAEAQPDSPTHQEVTAKLLRTVDEADLLKGRIGNRLVAQLAGYTPEEVQREYQHSHAVSTGADEPFILTPREKALKASLDTVMRESGEMFQREGPDIKAPGGEYRKMILKDTYRPSIASQDFIHAVHNNTADAPGYKRTYVDYMVGKGVKEAEAKQMFDDYTRAVGSKGITPDVKFGALTRQEGYGLPWELVDQNFVSAARRYGDRAANTLSYFKNIQNDPRMQKALDIADQYGNKVDAAAHPDVEYIGGHEKVKDAMRSVLGIDVPPNPRIQSSIRAVGATIMGTGTAARNLIQLPATVAPYYGVNAVTALKAIGKMNERAGRAFENNAVHSSFKDFDAAGDFDGSPDKFVSLADKFVGFMRRYSGRDLSDKLEGQFTYSLGEELATKWFAQAKDGDIKARAMLQRFGTTLDGKVAERFSSRAAPVTQDDVARVAKQFVNATRGTYGPGGLPSVALEGNLTPLLSLSRWGIERSNTFYKDVIRPLTDNGDIMPLLKTTFATLLSGAAIEKLNELLSNKRGQDPTIAETLAKATPASLTAKAIGLAQLGSFAGIVGDAMKVGSNLAQGKDSKFANPVSFPAGTLAEDMVQRTGQMMGALRDGEDPFEVLAGYMGDVLKSSQNARYLMSYANADETARKEKFRDIRTFEELTGRRQPEPFTPSNPYESMEAKKFKRTEDVAEAIQLAPALVAKAVKEATGVDGRVDVERLRAKLASLRGNNSQTFPAVERNPREAKEYMDYLDETQGSGAGLSRAKDYYLQRARNQVKTRMIPSL